MNINNPRSFRFINGNDILHIRIDRKADAAIFLGPRLVLNHGIRRPLSDLVQHIADGIFQNLDLMAHIRAGKYVRIIKGFHQPRKYILRNDLSVDVLHTTLRVSKMVRHMYFVFDRYDRLVAGPLLTNSNDARDRQALQGRIDQMALFARDLLEGNIPVLDEEAPYIPDLNQPDVDPLPDDASISFSDTSPVTSDEEDSESSPLPSDDDASSTSSEPSPLPSDDDL